MNFRIRGLEARQFDHLFTLSDAELAEHGGTVSLLLLNVTDGTSLTPWYYTDWLRGRPNEIVWHGRVNGISRANRTKIAKEARKHIGQVFSSTAKESEAVE